MRSAQFVNFAVTADDAVFADGVLFAPAQRVKDILSTAEGVREKERPQAQEIRGAIEE